MTKKGKLDGLDATVGALFGASFALPALISVYGLDIRLLSIPSICYGSWIFIIGYFQPKVSFSDFPERSEIERIRGLAYITGLPICLVLNFLFVFLLPKDISTLLIGSALIAVLLGIAVFRIPRNIFKKDIARMDDSQTDLLRKMLTYAGGSIIYSSMALLYITTTITWVSSDFIVVVILSILSAGLLIVGYDRYRKSSRYANDLAESIKVNKKKARQKIQNASITKNTAVP